jgi:hypothetical protein
MMKKIDIIVEEYETLVKSPHALEKIKSYPVFKNPTSSELGEIKKKWQEDNMGGQPHVSFISHINKETGKTNLYVVDRRILHDIVIKHLKLPITTRPSVTDAFLGTARITNDNKLKFHESNMIRNENPATIVKLHGDTFNKYFVD